MRKLALALLVFATLLAPLSMSAGLAAEQKPVKLQLIRVEAIETNDGGLAGGDADELVVEVNGAIVFGPQDIGTGETLDLSAVGLKTFRKAIKVRLIARDVVGADGVVSETTIGRGLAGDGVQTRLLRANGAGYNLIFKVNT